MLPQSDLSFDLRCGQGTRCLPSSARSLVHHDFPSTCILPPSLPSLSPVSAHLETTYLARALPYILHIFEQLSPCILLGLGITWAFSHPHLFVSRPGVLSGFQRRHIESTRAPRLQPPLIRQRGPHTSFLPQILPLECVLPCNQQYSWYTH